MQQKWFVQKMDSNKVYFNYKRAPYLLSKWPVAFLTSVEIGALLSEFFLNRTAYLQIIAIPLILYCCYRILKRKEDEDRAVEASIVGAELAGVPLGDGNAEIIAREYFIVTPKEEYLKNKRFMLVVLSNGAVYRYGVEPAEKNGFVLDKTPCVCEDETELALVKKHKEKLKKEDRLFKTKRNAGIAAACILAFGVASIGIVIWLGEITTWMKIVGWIVLSVFTLSFVLSLSLSPFEGRRGFWGMVYKVSSWIFVGLWFLVQLVFPTLLLLMGFLFIILVPYGLLSFTLKAASTIVEINPQTIIFISLSAGAIISAFYSKPLFGWLSHVLMSNGHRYEKYFQEMVEYVYQPSNIQFVIYLLYFIYLAGSTVHQFQAKAALFGDGWDMAVLESFLIFIAFSNLKKKRAGAAFSFSELFGMMWGMWTTHDNEKEGI